MRRTLSVFVIALLIGGLSLVSGNPSDIEKPAVGRRDAAGEQHGQFTGEVKLVFYVKDVLKSVEFYRGALGFTFHSYHDYDTGKSVTEWNKSTPPIYAEMSAGDQKFGLHLPRSAADERCLGRGKIYFRVKDVDAHHNRIKAWGVEPGRIHDTAWMRMFSVTDPDGLRIYFATTDESVHTIDPW